MKYCGVVTDRSWANTPLNFFPMADNKTRLDLLDYNEGKGCFTSDEMDEVSSRRIYSDEVPMANYSKHPNNLLPRLSPVSGPVYGTWWGVVIKEN